MSRADFDAIVIGGGHAGTEAARVIARGGLRVALITLIRDAIGRMSCNPAIGGLAKGHLVKEIDALGGLMGEATDAAGIQFKVLNRSKGPAVQGPRAQCDRDLYSAAVQDILAREPNITVVVASVAGLIFAGQAIAGVTLGDGSVLRSPAVVVTTGTFLRALMHSGETKTAGGRFGEPSAETFSDSLRRAGLRLGRLKTGTPPRVLRESADYDRMEPQPGDPVPRPFSILTDRITQPQILCWVTYTQERTHELILANLHRAPMYSGQIQAAGPRYCPSIEDKVVRFADKARHHVFVEPEGLNHPWLYLNGISTSLPADIQDAVIHSIPGLEKAVIARYGYAVEYDFVNPEQLDPTLQVRGISGLFLAGQINGTSGYEEAAAQGLIAGMNVVLKFRNAEPLVIGREQGYLGVMIDDLVTLGTEEPYRMFTSRAEHRLLLGCDSVYERLSPISDQLGLLDQERRKRVEVRIARKRRLLEELGSVELVPDRPTVARFLEMGLTFGSGGSLAKLMQRPEFDLKALVALTDQDPRFRSLVEAVAALSEEELEGVVNQTRYAGYIEKQQREASKLRDEETVRIPSGFPFERPGLSREIVEKLNFIRPVSLAQAARIRGMTPAAVAILRMNLRVDERRDHDAGRTAPALQTAASQLDG